MCTPNRYTWYICIALMICTSLHDYLYPMTQRRSIPQTSLVINLTQTHARTHAIVKVYRGPRPCRIESRQISGLSMKHAWTCSTFHFNSLALFAFEVSHGFVVCWYIFQNPFVSYCCCFVCLSGISVECQAVWIQIMPDVLSGLIWVQIVCKCNQQTTLVSKEFMTTIQAN